jgi:hypothetical protein
LPFPVQPSVGSIAFLQRDQSRQISDAKTYQLVDVNEVKRINRSFHYVTNSYLIVRSQPIPINPKKTAAHAIRPSQNGQLAGLPWSIGATVLQRKINLARNLIFARKRDLPSKPVAGMVWPQRVVDQADAAATRRLGLSEIGETP